MLSAAHLADVHADLDGLRARLDTMVAAAAGPRVVIPTPRSPGTNRRESLPPGNEQAELAEGASADRAQPMPGTVETIARGLELPTLARRRFRAYSGCVLAGADRKSRAGGLAGRHPAAKVLALWRADLADGLACRPEYESRAWGYAALRWLVIDPGGAAGAPGRLPEPGEDVGQSDIARLRAVIGRADGTARRSGVEQARQALVRRLSTDVARLLLGRCGAEANRELLAVSAEATLLAGRLTYVCWPSAALAQAYFVQALALAQACGDRELGAAVLCAMSEQAFFNGHLDEARNLVSAALKGTRDVPPPGLAVHFRLLAARDHLHRDELAPCVRALKDAVTEFDGAEPGHERGWTRWFTESDPLLFALVLADAYQAAELPGPAREIRSGARLPALPLAAATLRASMAGLGSAGAHSVTGTKLYSAANRGDMYVLFCEKAGEFAIGQRGRGRDEMPAKLRTALVSAAAAVVTAVALFGVAAPAFAKSDTQLSGLRVAHARHGFHLTVSVGDDAGARPASARLQLLGAHGRYQWFGAWYQLRLKNRDAESYAFTVTENRPCTVTFRAVVRGYAATNPVTVTVR